DGLAREVATEVAAALDHPAEVRLDHLGAEVGNVDPDAAVRRAPTLRDLEERGARHEVARRALHPPWVVALHEALAASVLEMAARAPEPLFAQRAGHQRARDHEPRRMELHHRHVGP